jgi:putative ferrous iron transport protein C
MSLIAIKTHMMKVKVASLRHLSLMFNIGADELRFMLAHWARKGKIRQCMKKPACSKSCFQCPTEAVEMYEWVDEVLFV